MPADAGLTRDPRLGSASRFAVFAGSTVTNTFLTTITGDLGTYPSTTAIGTTPPVIVGAFQLGNLVAQAAAADIVTAYNGLTPASMPGGTVLTGQDLGGKTLPPGIYQFSTSAQLTGALVLDAGNNPNAEWFFQIGSTLTTGPLGAAPASVTVINGGNRCNVFWQVGSAATLGTGTIFSGNILALSSITLVTGTTLAGRALAENGAVTMDTNTVSIATCP
jgi:type VI secretion system secreted protein VgrG